MAFTHDDSHTMTLTADPRHGGHLSCSLGLTSPRSGRGLGADHPHGRLWSLGRITSQHMSGHQCMLL